MGTRLQIRPVAGALGAEVGGINLADALSDDIIAEVRQALLENLVLFFRDQALTPAQHKAFASRFGRLHRHPTVKAPPEDPDLLVLETDRERPGQVDRWHSDVSSDEYPPMGSLLYARIVPERGGDTMWMNAYLAYETLSAPMRGLLDGLTATHSITRLYDLGIMRGEWEARRKASEAHPPMHHPVVRTHPVTGRKLLYVNTIFTECIDGVSAAESRAILDFLYAHIATPNFSCRLTWREGTLAFWDNRCTQHYGVNDYWPQHRLMHRYTIVGDRPV
ncbi:MAG: TauD/TfdA family dioxygenase [Gammaproteobacteria bacterium]|nr:TauD/TfdA family dioxygenase [Gammaproteobacteria bacterium]